MNRYYSGIEKRPQALSQKLAEEEGFAYSLREYAPLGITDASGVLLQTARWAVCFTQNHLIGSNPSSSEKQKKRLSALGIYWRRRRDSNPRHRGCR